MAAALALARRGLGRTWPNPAVGCVVVAADGRVAGRGWTQPGGRPHAEAVALARAGAGARGATIYVTLEPCDHHGRTPPCSEALIAAGVARVAAAIEDPDPRVSGRGLARLRAAGITVSTGAGAVEATEVNAGYLLRVRHGRPLFTLKLATTLDGRIAVHNGSSRWITGEAARAAAHGLRARHDAVLIGAGTALADDPELTCRLPGLEDASPVRVVVDSRLRLPPESRLARSAGRIPTWVVATPGADSGRHAALSAAGVTVIEGETDTDGRPSLPWLAAELGRRGLTRVLVEGGGELARALIAADLADVIAWFRAPTVIGDDGVGAVAPLGLKAPGDAPAFRRVATVELGADVLETYRRRG